MRGRGDGKEKIQKEMRRGRWLVVKKRKENMRKQYEDMRPAAIWANFSKCFASQLSTINILFLVFERPLKKIVFEFDYQGFSPAISMACLTVLILPSQYLTKIIRCQAAREKASVGNTFKLAKSGQFTMGFCWNHTLSIC